MACFAQDDVLSLLAVLMDALGETLEVYYSFLPYSAAAINYSIPCAHDVQRHSREYYRTVCALVLNSGQTEKLH